MTKSIKLEVYYGVSSPWAYLGHARLLRIARENGITIHLKPITVIVENGGLPLATRSDAYRAYHARDLERTARYLDVPFRGVPKQYYPQKAGDIQLAAQVIIRIQQKYGIGSEEVMRYTFAVQETIWYTEEADHCDIEFLRTLARRIGLEEEDVSALVVDKRDDMEDPAVIEWDENYKEAIALGVIGTPNYVVNGEVYWGQDRLNHVEAHIKELVREGAVPYVYA